jgi:D-lactate dehydrogenase
VKADVIILMQAANTGLTEGSTPHGNDYDRPLVIVSTLRLDKLQLIDEGQQVLAFPGSTLYQLEKVLKPLGREPHSVIGSSCIGASVLGGICNNSGGSLIKRGPAYSEMALYAQIDAQGRLKLVNHLGIDLGTSPEEILGRLDDDRWQPGDVQHDGRHASDHEYADRVREVDADTPARFNADPHRLFESAGSAGKVMIFAVRLDTFARDEPLEPAFALLGGPRFGCAAGADQQRRAERHGRDARDDEQSKEARLHDGLPWNAAACRSALTNGGNTATWNPPS